MTDYGSYTPEEYLNLSYISKGMNGWQKLYLNFLKSTSELEVCEIGPGSGELLIALNNMTRRVAVDAGKLYADVFDANGIEFYQRDVESSPLTDIGSFDFVICSDVFEHMRDPAVALQSIFTILKPSGALISHVPNEFTLRKTVKVMLGLRESLYFHCDHEEWTDPHVRRFTDRGFRKFLSNVFRYNLKITDMQYDPICKIMKRIRIPVPYALEGGPTYISTNDFATFDWCARIKDNKD